MASMGGKNTVLPPGGNWLYLWQDAVEGKTLMAISLMEYIII